MKIYPLLALLALLAFSACQQPAATEELPTTSTDQGTNPEDDFVWNPENFADKKIVRYQVPGFDQLSPNQKMLVYHLVEAGLAGRDIMYEQNYRHNLEIRKALDNIVANYKGDRSGENWEALLLYAKEVWFANGIHHHYSNDKFVPGFDQEYFTKVASELGITLGDEALKAMFDPAFDNKKVSQAEGTDLAKTSAVNFYAPDVTQAEVEAFYAAKIDKKDPTPISYGLNSRLEKVNGKIVENVYKVGGLYGPAIEKIVEHLAQAVTYAENEPQKKALELLIEFYQTGDLKKWDEYSIAWVEATEGDIDYINGFIEVYNDPMGMRGSYETIVQITDFDASARMSVVAENAQYFEDNSTILDAHKKKDVVGVSYKVVTVAGEAGDASPSTPIGVNLPNANWIRGTHGSKSVSLGNIVQAYANADGPCFLSEFSNDEEEIARAEKYGKLSGKMHTALHEVIGHASGQLEPGVGQPSETMKQYASPLEEARADLVSLYYLMDPKLIELGLMENLDVAKAQYDSYLKNGYMLQLRRIKPGNTIEQAHMRNRSMVSHWVIEKGLADGSVVIEKRDGKTFIDIKDYEKLRVHFGELLREVQRIKSQGDFAAVKNIFETYGVQVDAAIHEEVLARSEKLNIPPYGGFINPRLVAVKNDAGKVTDVKVEYPDDFVQQMLEYGNKYSFLTKG